MMILQLSRANARPPDPPPGKHPPTAKGPRNVTPQQGVTDDEIALGMSAAFSGPARELGRGMKLGVETYFRQLNDAGGVAGRKVNLVALDDEYEPAKARPNLEELIQKRN